MKNAPVPATFAEIFAAVKDAAPVVAALDDARRAEILCATADAVSARAEAVLTANAADCARLSPSDPKFDRLLLTRERLASVAADMRRVAALPSPLGRVLDERVRPNGLKICKIAVPFGVVGVIFEARPNVTADVFSLCFKSGNACVLKGAHDAAGTNAELASVIRSVLEKFGVPAAACTLLPPDRAAAGALLNAVGIVDVVIPRGSRSLIDFARASASIPVIETGAGVCHAFIDESADLRKAEAIVFNAKTRRVSVCNALDCLLVHEKIASSLPQICARLAEKNVKIFADEKAFAALDAGNYPKNLLAHAVPEDFGTEFLDYKLCAKVVGSLDEAVAHIARFGSRHSECIVAENAATAARFMRDVDAACVYANASTAFTDGGEFGFGAEIGISTQKLHARGPMGLEALTTYKYFIFGDGQTR